MAHRIIVAALGATLVTDGAAQSPDRRTITGVVIDSARNAIPYVNVEFGSTRTVTTDSGRFLVRSARDGVKLTFMRIGFERVDLLLRPGSDTTVTVVLTPVAMKLSAIEVVAASSAKLELRGFYGRMRDVEKGINRGYFITPEDIERRKPPFITQMLESFPTIRVERQGMSELYAQIVGSNRCRMTVYLDGIRVIGKLNPGGEEPINQLVRPGEVAGIEVYPQSVTAPPQYQSLNGTCGIVLIWTK